MTASNNQYELRCLGPDGFGFWIAPEDAPLIEHLINAGNAGSTEFNGRPISESAVQYARRYGLDIGSAPEGHFSEPRQRFTLNTPLSILDRRSI